MTGNVWEWNLDWYATYWNPCTDCAWLIAGGDRVIRGGGAVGGAPLRAGFRNYAMPSSRGDGGARCARSP
jgi:formylglycine-generating enzyme required for sulfatase activity